MIKYLDGDFDKEIAKGKILVDFYADWCGPCRMMGSILENIKGINILKVNVDHFPLIAQRYGVMSIPTLIIFKDGELIKSNVGLINEDKIYELINE